MSTQAGRSCPLHYRYRPQVFAGPASLRAETAYVVGGIYGNVLALRRVLDMKNEEERLTGGRIDLFFNGDFNWFDCDAASFVEINEAVLEHHASCGNVEAELNGAADENGCGCNYPDYVDATVVDRSNAIMQRLQSVAAAFPDLCARVAALPRFRSVEIGGQKIGIVHGDAESLAGWGFAYEAMPALTGDPVASLVYRSSCETMARVFREAGVSVFASTHSGLPFVQDFDVDGQRRLVINNGAAGLPNFAGSTCGVLTRISSRSDAPTDSLYGTTLEGLRFDALAIRYDAAAWLARFLTQWPAGSPAHAGYFERITQGPDFSIAQAVRLARTDSGTNQRAAAFTT